jgi:ADP-ribosylglycohydrolase
MPFPIDHEERMERARLSLDGLSVGDAFGERFFFPPNVESLIERRAVPAPPWRITDDTIMALGIMEVLQGHAKVHQDELARVFARRYRLEPGRGYGATAKEVLAKIQEGVGWRKVAGAAFGGEGSMGNGAAMRVAPLGAYFADDLNRVVKEARASAQVTHAHPEGQAGAIAVALAAAWAWHIGEGVEEATPTCLLELAIEYLPEGTTRQGLVQALDVPLDAPPENAAHVLGSGQRVTAPDTVPFTLWCACRHLDDYSEALWNTLAGLGDRDTTCAIVGGIVALSAGRESIPKDWLRAREPLVEPERV